MGRGTQKQEKFEASDEFKELAKKIEEEAKNVELASKTQISEADIAGEQAAGHGSPILHLRCETGVDEELFRLLLGLVADVTPLVQALPPSALVADVPAVSAAFIPAASSFCNRWTLSFCFSSALASAST